MQYGYGNFDCYCTWGYEVVADYQNLVADYQIHVGDNQKYVGDYHRLQHNYDVSLATPA